MKQGKYVDAQGSIRYYKDDQLHRDGDLPAEEGAGGDGKYWWKNGLRHRDGGLPAEEWPNGDRRWYQNDQLHRDGDLPAEEFSCGSKSWYKDGLRHRDNDLPAEILIPDGMTFWYQNGNRHRLAGPAWISAKGEMHWYINGKELTKEEHANHPEVKKYKLQQVLNRVLKE
jgi:hypothetical protein